MSSIKKNAISNYFAKLWGVVSVYVFIPFYIHFLGDESYALIAFQSVILSFIFIADAGLGASFARECAKESNGVRLRALLSSIEKVMFLILSFVALVFFLCAHTIATSWLKIDSTSLFDTAVIALKLMAISIIPQVMISLYYGGLMGLERQVNANAINICYSFLRSGAVIIPLYFWGNLISYFSWYLCVSCIFLLIFRLFLLKQIKLDKDLNEFVKEVDTNGYSILKGLYSFSLGMLFLSVISAVNNQLDRLYVSYKFTLKEFTYYNLSSILGQAAFLIVLPLAVTVLPNLTKLANEKKGKSYQGIYEQFSYYISGISATAVFSLILYLNDIVFIWLGKDYINTPIISLVPFLAIGTLFLSLQLMPFQLSIANGHNKTSVLLGAVSLIIYPLMLYFFCKIYGINGATSPWIVINILNFVVLGFYINKKYYVGATKWFVTMCFVPVSVSFIVVVSGGVILNFLHLNHLSHLVAGGGVGIVSLLISALIFKKWIKQ